MPRRTHRLRGGAKTARTARQKRLSMLKKTRTARAHLRRGMSMFKNPPKRWHNPLKPNGPPLRTSIDYLKKIIRLLKKIERSAEESTNDDERYELHSFIASTLKDRTSELFVRNNIQMPIGPDTDPDDPFDYIKDLIAYIEDIIQKTNNIHNPQLMAVSSRKLADVLEEVESLVNKDIEQDQRRRNSRKNNNSDVDDLLRLFNSFKV